MLVKRSKKETPYSLPIRVNNFETIWYYDSEYLLFKAYRQLKRLNGVIKPRYPVVYDIAYIDN